MFCLYCLFIISNRLSKFANKVVKLGDYILISYLYSQFLTAQKPSSESTNIAKSQNLISSKNVSSIKRPEKILGF